MLLATIAATTADWACIDGKGESCEPCIDGKLNGKGEDYDGTVAQTASGKTCKWWNGVEDANGYKYAYPSHVLTSADKK